MRILAVLSLAEGLLLAACAAAPAGPHPVWSSDAQSLENPWPDGRLVDAAGHPKMRPGFYTPFVPQHDQTDEAATLFEGYASQMNQLDGFGTFAGLFVRFSDPVDATADLGKYIFVVSVEGTPHRIAAAVQWHDAPAFAVLQPTEPLRPGTKHALIVARGLNAGGKAVVRSADFAAYAQGAGQSEVEAAAHAAGLVPDDVLMVTTFKTQSIFTDLQEAAKAAEAQSPTADFTAQDSPPRGIFTRATLPASLSSHTRGVASAGAIAIGTYQSLDMRGPEGTLSTTGGTPTALEFVLVEPNVTQHPPPWPVVVVQHGFDGSNRFVLDVAKAFNDDGLAVIGIDAVDNGARGSVLNLFNLSNVPASRDSFRQTVLDQLQLVRLVQQGAIDVDGVPGPDFNGTVNYFGHSMGAIVGTMHAAIASHHPVAVLNADGGGLTGILQSPSIEPAIELLTRPALGLLPDDPAYASELPFFLAIVQTLFDAGDPMNYASLLQPPRAGLLIEEGLGDRTVPNTQTEELAAAIGLPATSTAAQDSAGLRALWRIDQSQFGVSSQQDPHNNFLNIEGVRKQAARFLASGGTVLVDPAHAE